MKPGAKCALSAVAACFWHAEVLSFHHLQKMSSLETGVIPSIRFQKNLYFVLLNFILGNQVQFPAMLQMLKNKTLRKSSLSETPCQMEGRRIRSIQVTGHLRKCSFGLWYLAICLARRTAEHLIPEEEPAHLMQLLDSSCQLYLILQNKAKTPNVEFTLQQVEYLPDFLHDKQNPKAVTEY